MPLEVPSAPPPAPEPEEPLAEATPASEPPGWVQAPISETVPEDKVDLTGVEPIAWEQAERYGDYEAFRRTMLAGIFSPMVFSLRIPWERGELRTPLVYALLCGIIGYTGLALTGAQVAPQTAVPGLEGLTSLSPTIYGLVMLPIVPPAIAVQRFVQAALGHALLSATKQTSRPFEATFRVYAYAQTAAVMLILPGIGPYAENFYMVFLVLGGVRAAHSAGFAGGLLALLPVLMTTNLLR